MNAGLDPIALVVVVFGIGGPALAIVLWGMVRRAVREAAEEEGPAIASEDDSDPD